MTRITFRQLEIFIAIAHTQSLRIAAQKVHLSQSAMSMALTTLEQQLGSRLFDRVGKRLIINEAGERLMPGAINIMQQLRTLEKTSTSNNQELKGKLLLGASSTIGNYLLPALIANFMQAHPQTHISLQINNTAQIILEVAKLRLDFGVIEGSCHHNDLSVTPWLKDQLVVVAAAQHPLAKKKAATIDDLMAARWIMREPGSGTREIFENAMGATVKPFLKLGTTEAIKQALVTGIGISCLPKITLTRELKYKILTIVKTPFLKLTRNFYFIEHKQKQKSDILQKFIEQCLKYKN